jgi:hypothetical protein
MAFIPKRFIDEPVMVSFDDQPLLEKMQGCPDGFICQGQIYRVAEMLREWHDYSRRGRSARNMQPQHAEVAKVKGSWGVGRDYYTVRTDQNQIFTIYYDRAPRDALTRSSGWFLLEELAEAD